MPWLYFGRRCNVLHCLWETEWLVFSRFSHHILGMTTYFVQYETPFSSKYHTTLFRVSHHPLQSTTSPSSKNHLTLFKASPSSKIPDDLLQCTTLPSSKYHTTLFKVSYHPLKSIIHPFKSIIPPSSENHATLFKVPHAPLQSITRRSS